MYAITLYTALLMLISDYYRFKKLRGVCFLLFVISSSVIIYLRPEYKLMTDYQQYFSYFGEVNYSNFIELSNTYGFETGFGFLSATLAWLFGSERMCFVIIYMVSICTSYFAISKLCKDACYGNWMLPFAIYIMSYIIYIYLGQIRQGISLALGLYALSIYQDKKYKTYFCLVCLAMTVHVTSIVLLVLPFLKYINTKLLLTLALCSFSLVLIDLVKPLILFLSQHIPMGDFIYGKITSYNNSQFAEKVGFSVIQVYYILISVLAYYYIPKTEKTNIVFYYKVFLIGVILNFSLNSFSVLLRLSYYFLAIDCILLGYILSTTKNINSKIIIYLVIVIIFSLRFAIQWGQYATLQK